MVWDGKREAALFGSLAERHVFLSQLLFTLAGSYHCWYGVYAGSIQGDQFVKWWSMSVCHNQWGKYAYFLIRDQDAITTHSCLFVRFIS